MGYVKAEKVLPQNIIHLIQKYVDGQNIYIPKREGCRKAWGSITESKNIIEKRNKEIYTEYLAGMKTKVLAEKYFLSEKSVQRIVREERRKRDEL